MATLIICPRCRGSLQPDTRACPRCGLLLSGYEGISAGDQEAPRRSSDKLAPPLAPQLAGNDAGQHSSKSETYAGGTTAYAPAREIGKSVPPQVTGGARDQPGASRLVPRGAIELLPGENVAFQLGALYLTNKRVILLAPSVVRAAFLRDVDAIGTLTERSSAWRLFSGLLLLGLSAAGLYASVSRRQWEDNFPALYLFEPAIGAVILLAASIVLLVTYFVWVKRTLFVSVGGRPLITVSISNLNARRLEGMDAFVNAYFEVREASDRESLPTAY